MANTFDSFFSKNVGTTAVTVYTVPSLTKTTIIGLTISNTTLSNIIVDVYISRGGNDYYILKNTSIVPGTATVPVGGEQKVIMNPSDVLNVKSDTAASSDVILSVLNIT